MSSSTPPPSRRPLGRHILSHPRDWLNVARSATAPLLIFYPFVSPVPFGSTTAYLLLMFVVIGDANYLLHLHVHRPFLRSKVLNRALDIALGFTTGMTSANWRIQHVYGHHVGRDRAFRVEAPWAMARFSIAGALWFSAGSIPRTIVMPIVEAWRKRRQTEGPIDYAAALREQLAFVCFVGALSFHDPWLTATYLLPWYLTTYFISRYVDYLNHYGCDEGDNRPLAAANSTTSRIFNRTTHNFGFHAAHHLRPAAHWTELPKIHAQVAHEIPPERLKTFSWSFLCLPLHFVRALRGRM